MKIIATKGSVNAFLQKHKDFIPLIDRVKEKGSTFLIKNTSASIKDLKLLIPMFRANGTTNFSEITYVHKPQGSIAGTVANPDIKDDKALLSPYVSIYMQGARCDIAANGPAYLKVYSVSDYKNTLVFENDEFGFTPSSPTDPNIMLKPPDPVFDPVLDPYPQYSLAV